MHSDGYGDTKKPTRVDSLADNESSADCPVIDSSQLFGRHKQLVIGHNGARYILKITRHGKLILNK